MKPIPRNTRWFERWAAKHCMKAICKVDDPDGEILLADSVEPIRIFDARACVSDKCAVVGYPHYHTGYAIHRNGLEFGNYEAYSTSDFLIHTKAGGVQTRVNEALAYARAAQMELKKSGFYDAAQKRRFSHRPN